MGRPSVKKQRAEEILDAFEVCVGHYGVEGATLERLSEQSGLARALIRHHIGNRDELLSAMVDRFLARSKEEADSVFDQLPSSNRVQVFINGMFDVKYSDPHQMRVVSALLIAMRDQPELAERLEAWTKDFVKAIAAILRDEFPQASKIDIATVATGVAGLYFSVDTLSPPGNMAAFRRSSERAATLLVDYLAGLSND